MVLQRSSKAVALEVAVLPDGLQSLGSVALCATKLIVGFLGVSSVAMQATKLLRNLSEEQTIW